jgi:fucose 4-O-acetylase-like acetyltransferase
MLLVVIGHLTRPGPPGLEWAGKEWYGVLKSLIYHFHMPFFMFISGFLLFYSLKPINTAADYLRMVGRRAYRIVPGYVIYGLLAVAGKILLSHYFKVDKAPRDFWQGIGDVLLRPEASAATQLWYLYVLFLYSAIMPIVFTKFGRCLALLVPVALVAHFIPADSLFASNLFLEYLLVLVLGCLAAKHYAELRQWIQGCPVQVLTAIIVCLMAVFACSLLVVDFLDRSLGDNTSKLVIGLLSIPALWSLMLTRASAQGGVLETIGKYTLVIFLLHAPIIAAIRLPAVKFNCFSGMTFDILFPVMVFLGIAIPIFLKKKFFSRFRWLDQITG